MSNTAHIGPTISIKGEVTSEEPLTIAGHVDGSVEVAGHVLTIVEGGKRVGTPRGSCRVGITTSCVVCVFGSRTVILPCPLDTA